MSRKWITLDSKCLVSGTSFLAKEGKKSFLTHQNTFIDEMAQKSATQASKVILVWSKNFRNLFSFLQLLDKVKSAFDSTFNSQYFFPLLKKYLLICNQTNSNIFHIHTYYIIITSSFTSLFIPCLYLKQSPEYSDLAR